MSIEGKVMVITGASSGIGEVTARRLARDGASVVVGARREERLTALAAELNAAGGRVEARATDVADRASVQALVDHARTSFGPVDVLINNAATAPHSLLETAAVDDWERMIDVNIKGVLYGIAAVLPEMRQRKSGQIVTIGSVNSHLVFPRAAVYSGTKFAIWAISEGLRQEVGSDVQVTVISPGAVTTELLDTITDAETAEEFEQYRGAGLAANAVAEAIAFAIAQPRDVDVNEIVLRPTAQQF